MVPNAAVCLRTGRFCALSGVVVTIKCVTVCVQLGLLDFGKMIWFSKENAASLG